MKKLFLVSIILLIALSAGCYGNHQVVVISLEDFIGDWYMTGFADVDLDGRIYSQPIDRVVYFRDGYVEDSYGYGYTAYFSDGVLWLTRDEGVGNYDPYCGFFEGGLEMTYVFQGISPVFDQFYEGNAVGNTAVYTQRCQYKNADISVTAYLNRVN
ncbi:MAG: hypothetical protein ABIG42_04655 [bacterium]